MSILRKAFLVLASVAVTATSVHAQEIQLTPVVGYRFFGSVHDWTGTEVSVDEAMSYGGYLTYQTDPNNGIEFGFSRQDTRATLSIPFEGREFYDVKVDYWTLGGVRQFRRPGSNVVPFGNGFLGLGRMSSSDGSDSSTKFMLGLGGGAKIMPVSGPLGVRLEGRGYFTFAGNGGASVGCGTGGCGFGFGGQAFFQLEVLAGLIVRLGNR